MPQKTEGSAEGKEEREGDSLHRRIWEGFLEEVIPERAF